MGRIKKIKGFRSKFEFNLSESLDNKRIPYKYEDEVISYVQPAKNRKYTPDFILEKKRSGKMYIETKGRWVTEDRNKMKLIVNQHPDLDIRLLFQNANQKIRKNAKMTYGEWATKNGIVWANKELPTEWLKELKYHKF